MTKHKSKNAFFSSGLCRISFIVAATMFSASLMAQNAATTVKGVVSDDYGNPLTGAVVHVEGTKQSTVTDINGHYSLTCNPTPKLRISVSYIGFKTTSSNIAQAHGGILDFKLSESDAENISEVVVTGYSTMKKESLSSAISIINSKDK